MLSLSDKSPGPSWAKNPPVSFNIYSSTNPDMVTVFYYPLNDVVPDSSQDNNFSAFKKQLVDLNILKSGVKSMDYIDDEDDVIHIDSEHEFMEALKFAQAYKEKNGQSVFLLIDEKSEEVVTESAMILSEEDPAESIVEEVMSTRKIAFDKSKGKGFSMGGGSKAKSLKERKRYKSAKADDKFEPSACCQKYLEKFKEEIVAEVTKNVMKKLASAFNTANLGDAAKETPEEETRHQPDALEFCCTSNINPQANHIKSIIDSPKKSPNIVSDVPLPGFNQILRSYAEKAAKDKTLDREYSIHKVPNYPHYPAFYGPNLPGRYFPSHPMIPPFYPPLNPMPYVRPGNIVGPSEPSPFSRGNNGLYFNDYTQDYPPICSPDLASVVDSVPAPAQVPVSPSAEEKNGDCQKKKPKITDSVILNRDDLTERRKNLVEQAKKMMLKKPNALEIKSTIKKMATPSPKKSSSSKIKNKSKMEKELMMNVKKMCNFKIDDQVQKTSGCKRKSRSTDEILNLWATRCSLLNHIPGSMKYSPDISLNSNLESSGIFAMSSLDSGKDEDKETKVVKDAVEDKEIQDNDEKNSDQDEQSSDDASTLSEMSNLSPTPSEPNNFALVFYDKDTNNFDVKEDSREVLDFMIRKDPASMIRSLGKDKPEFLNEIKKAEKEASTELDSKPLKQSDEPKKEVRFEVEVEDIGPDESEELIPELNKRSGGGYSFVSETLPKAKETITESTASADEKNTKKEKSSQQSQEQYQQSSEFYDQNNFSPSLSQPMTSSGYETLYPEKSTTGTKTKSEKKSKDKDSQQKHPSYSATVPNVSAHCFVMKSSAENVKVSKLSKAEEKLKKAEKKFKEAEKKCKEAEKKSKSAKDQSSRSKSARDDCASSSSRYPEFSSNKPGYPPHATHACYSSAKSSPKHNYPYGCESPKSYYSLFDPVFVDSHSTASKPGYSGVSSFSDPMPPMYPPPPPYPPNFPPLNSNTRPNPLGPSATNRPPNPEQGYFPPPPPPFNPCHMTGSGMHSRNPGNSFNPSQSFPDNIAREAAAQAFVHARQAVNSYIMNQLNNKP